jgi:hypothetical protein
MEIVLDVASASDGRLCGTVAMGDHRDPVPFWGTLELVARIEDRLGEDPGPSDAEARSAT